MPRFNLDRRRTALICVDFQSGLFTGGEGALPCVGAAAVLPKAKQVLAAARLAQLPIIHLQEVHRKERVDFGRELD